MTAIVAAPTEYAEFIDSDAYRDARIFRETDMRALFTLAYHPNKEYDKLMPFRFEYISGVDIGLVSVSGAPLIEWNGKRYIQGKEYELSLRDAAAIVCDYSSAIDLHLSHSTLSMSQCVTISRYGAPLESSRFTSVSDAPIDPYALKKGHDTSYTQLRTLLFGKGVVKANVILTPSLVLPCKEFEFLKHPLYIGGG